MTYEKTKITAKQKELVEGMNGSGQTTWTVAVINPQTGYWLHTDTFTNKQEAELWMKWA